MPLLSGLKISAIMKTATFKTPLGIATITGDENGIATVSIADNGTITTEIPEVLQEAIAQLHQYFNKTRTNFTFKLNPKGTDFQQKVWKSLLEIPYGKTLSYLELSKKLGDGAIGWSKSCDTQSITNASSLPVM
jgi:methylated-DNA-[protein]-cysteine S-methyltransferase